MDGIARRGFSDELMGTLATFESGNFDMEQQVGNLTEKGIEEFRANLAAVDAECTEELRKTVHQNYTHFIVAAQVFLLPPPCCTKIDCAGLALQATCRCQAVRADEEV